MTGIRLRAGVVLALVFLAGCATGALLMRARVKRTAIALLDGPPDRLIERLVVWRIARDVSLTPEQKERIGDVVRRGRERTSEVRRRIHPELAADWAVQAREIREILTPDQRPALDRLVVDWNARARSAVGLTPDAPAAR